jgi:hypothetical protein
MKCLYRIDLIRPSLRLVVGLTAGARAGDDVHLLRSEARVVLG